MKPVVAIIGRPNVGKSTVFNRLIHERRAIEDDRPGVTRDAIIASCEWEGVAFDIVDTGGFDPSEDNPIGQGILEVVRNTIAIADVLIWIVDIRKDLCAADWAIADELRHAQKPVLLAANKADNRKFAALAVDFYQLGVEEVFPVSAIQGLGFEDLLDRVVEHLQQLPDLPENEPMPEGVIPVAIVGRPNVGKSTLLNQLVGQQRALVTEVAGTTRDPVDSLHIVDDQPYLLIDTAGIRRPGKLKDIEKFSVLRALRAVERAEVVLLLVNADEGITETDAKVFGQVSDLHRATIIVVNKWDLVEKDTSTAGEYAKKIRETVPFLRESPIVFISALTGQRAHRLWEMIKDTHTRYHQRIGTGELNRLLQQWVGQRPPLGWKGRTVKIHYITQADTAPPTFVLFVSDVNQIHFSYQRYIANRIYETMDLGGAPVVLEVRSSRNHAPA